MKPRDLSLLLSHTIPAKLPVLIKGAPGVGKSDIVAAASQSAGAELIISHPVTSDPTDYKGLPGVVNGEAHFLPFGELQSLIRAERPTVFFLDDLGQAAPAVQAAAMQLILARRINGHHVSPQVTFIAATNRRTDKAGVSGILEPVKSRFSTIIELEPDLQDWIDWALAENLPIELVAFIRFRPNLLHDFKASSDITNTPCPRTVTYAGKLLAAGIPEALQYDAFTGAAGEGFAAEFVGFLRIWKQLPNPDAVLMNPASAPVPEDPATLYALCGALSRKASDQNADRFFAYSNRLPAEFSVMMTRDAIRMTPSLQTTKGFIQWTSAHQDVLF
jgi:hypothetical protein